jgi:hypothetical protein
MTVQSKSPEQIESEIRSTRRDIDRTLDALQTRLSPGQLLDQALSYAKSGGGEFATNFGRTVTQNPIPVTLLGLGVLWLMCSQPRAQAGGNGQTEGFAGRARDWGDAAAEATGDAAATVRQWGAEARDRTYAAAETAQDTAREYAHAAGDTARRAAHRAEDYASAAWHQGTRAGQKAQQIIDDYPLVVGAVGLAVGALAAALLPSTRREDELMGDKADELKRAASNIVREQVEPVREVAKAATEAAADAAAQEAHRQGLTTGSDEDASAAERVGMAPGDKQSATEVRS